MKRKGYESPRGQKKERGSWQKIKYQVQNKTKGENNHKNYTDPSIQGNIKSLLDLVKAYRCKIQTLAWYKHPLNVEMARDPIQIIFQQLSQD